MLTIPKEGRSHQPGRQAIRLRVQVFAGGRSIYSSANYFMDMLPANGISMELSGMGKCLGKGPLSQIGAKFNANKEPQKMSS